MSTSDDVDQQKLQRQKVEENEHLHMRLFQTSQELELVKEELRQTRAELARQTLAHRSENTSQRQPLELQDQHARTATQRGVWTQIENAITSAERTASKAMSALEAAKKLASVHARSAFPAEVALGSSIEVPWWATGERATRVGEMLKTVVPLLRQLMTTYTVHHIALRERLYRFQALDGARAASPSHIRAARRLVDATERHHRCLIALHTGAVSLRSAVCPPRTETITIHAAVASGTSLKQTIDPVLGAGGSCEGNDVGTPDPIGVGLLAWKTKGAFRGLAEVYEDMRVCWEEELREETTWAERVLAAEAFGPQGDPAVGTATATAEEAGAAAAPRASGQARLLQAADQRASKAHAALAQAVSTLERLLSRALTQGAYAAAQCSREDEEGAAVAEAGGEVMQAGEEWAYALEAKMEAERLAGVAVSAVSSDRMVKSSASICDIIARLCSSAQVYCYEYECT
jgi:hypothetical protein